MSQIPHFKALGFNVFRLPIGWQYLQPSGYGTNISSTIWATYTSYIQNITQSSSAKVIVDIHNYARLNGSIVGQTSVNNTLVSPLDSDLVNVWTQIATNLRSNPNVIFGVMNEPHDLNVTIWANTVQQVVNAIRAAGATSQYILIPGNNYTNAATYVKYSVGVMSKVVDPVNSAISLLLYDVHQYLDATSAGVATECVTDHVSDALAPLATYLRANQRQAFLSEIGGGNTASCAKYINQALSYLANNTDVYYGFTAWSAGSFSLTYNLTLTPFANGTDQSNVPLLASFVQ